MSQIPNLKDFLNPLLDNCTFHSIHKGIYKTRIALITYNSCLSFCHTWDIKKSVDTVLVEYDNDIYILRVDKNSQIILDPF